ncbi:putative Phytocyanin domain, cupredoxin [Dioscorea sansibarensis]
MNVSESDFETCTAPPGTTTLVSGDDVVELTTPGNKWYICGVPGHCTAANQKLAITVLPSSPPSSVLAPPQADYSSFSRILMSSNSHTVLVLVTLVMLIM